MADFTFPSLKRSSQVKPYYCGPAVVQMLLSFIDIKIKQKDLVESVFLESKIAEHGLNLYELFFMVKHHFPRLNFWIKNHSQITDLDELINVYLQPAGVEWQGIFDYEDEEEAGDDDDPGHYSIVTGIDLKNNFITLADPEKHYRKQDRQLQLKVFEDRWWDQNAFVDPVTQKKQMISDYHTIFVITQPGINFPHDLRMEKI